MYGIFLYFLWRSHASHQSSNLNKVVRVAHHFVIIYSGPKFSSVVIIRSEQICFLLVVVRSVKWHKRKVRVQKLRDWDIDVCCVQTFKIHTNAFPLSRRALRLQYAAASLKQEVEKFSAQAASSGRISMEWCIFACSMITLNVSLLFLRKWVPMGIFHHAWSPTRPVALRGWRNRRRCRSQGG